MKIRIALPRSYYPRSFLTLLLLAFFVVAAPLVLGLIDAAWYVDQMMGQSRAAVVQAAQAARMSRMLMEQATALERDYLVRILRMADGNVMQAAKMARRNRTEFYRLLDRHHIEPKMFKRTSE